jgi:acetyltransferase-like isoleucine patch superfamily enzyme
MLTLDQLTHHNLPEATLERLSALATLPQLPLAELKPMVPQWQVLGGDASLRVFGHLPTSATGRFKLLAKGPNNILVIEEGVSLNEVRFELRGHAFIYLGRQTRIIGSLIASPGCAISIGSHTKFNKPCRLHAAEACNITLGEGCLLANVRFRTSDSHSIVDLDTQQRVNPAKSITVGNRVWFAEDVNVYKGVTIGDGSIIASHSTVLKPLPAHCVAAGTPAKPVKTNVTWHEDLLPVTSPTLT